MRRVRVGDIGVQLIIQFMRLDCLTGLQVPHDVSAATTLEIRFARPDGTVVDKPAVFTLPGSCGTGDGTDGKVSVFTVPTDITLRGRYQYEGYVVDPALTPTFDGRSEIVEFEAADTL